MKVYISGKISGLDCKAVEAKFRQAEDKLIKLGFEPVNPLNNGLSACNTWEEHMLRDIEHLFDCDAILMLNDWRRSKGARIEYSIAVERGMEVMFLSRLILDDLKEAIKDATGLSFEQYTGKSKTRDTFFARMIFANYCKEMRKEDIGRILNRDRSTVDYYINRHDDEVKYNPAFGRLAGMVEERMSAKERTVNEYFTGKFGDTKI
ncbi:MAG: DUF4406 domain-containing protein [Proteiniphilum sp.]